MKDQVPERKFYSSIRISLETWGLTKVASWERVGRPLDSFLSAVRTIEIRSLAQIRTHVSHRVLNTVVELHVLHHLSKAV